VIGDLGNVAAVTGDIGKNSQQLHPLMDDLMVELNKSYDNLRFIRRIVEWLDDLKRKIGLSGSGSGQTTGGSHMRIPWLIANVVLLILFGAGTYQQIVNQKNTNLVMEEVYQNISRSRALTEQTNRHLAPLSQTAAVMQEMNQQLSDTKKRLNHMNEKIGRVNASEQKIITGLDELNEYTKNVYEGLGEISSQNKEIKQLSQTISEQSNRENRSLLDLSKLTRQSIQELNQLNKKLAWLGLLP
jgi:methyl-accepting chemotaxis protein